MGQIISLSPPWPAPQQPTDPCCRAGFWCGISFCPPGPGSSGDLSELLNSWTTSFGHVFDIYIFVAEYPGCGDPRASPSAKLMRTRTYESLCLYPVH